MLETSRITWCAVLLVAVLGPGLVYGSTGSFYGHPAAWTDRALFLAIIIVPIALLLRPWFKNPQDLVWPLLALTIGGIYFLKYYHSEPLFDEQGALWTGWNVLQGNIPYKDFFEIKPPMLFLLNAVGLGLFGLDHYRLIFGILIMLSVLALFGVQRRLGITPWLAGAVTLHYVFIIHYPGFHDNSVDDPETIGLAFSILGLACALWPGPQSRSTFLSSAAGFLLGLAVLTKEPFLWSALTVMAVVFFYYGQTARHLAFSRLLGIAAGGAGLAAAFVIYLIINDAWTGYMNHLSFSLQYQKWYALSLGIVAPGTWWQVLLSDIGQLHGRYYNLALLFSLFPFYVAFFWKYRLTPLSLSALAGIGLGAYAVSMGHCFFNHYFLLGTLTLLIPAIFGGQAISAWLERPDMKKWMFRATAAMVLLFAGLQNALPIQTDLGVTYVKARLEVPQIIRETVELHSAPGDYILVTGYPILYVLLNRKHAFNAAGLMLDNCAGFFNHGDVEKTLAENRRELESKQPKVIYIAEGYWGDQQRWYVEKLIMPFIAAYKYQKVNDSLYYLPGPEAVR